MKQPRFYYGWVVVAVSFTCLAIAYGVWHSFAIFLVPMLAEFGWSRAATAMAFSIFSITYGCSAPLSGAAVDRLGPRVVIPIGSAILALGLFVASLATELWHIYLSYGVMAALGVNLVGTTVNFTVLANWFARRRGTAVGIASAGIGVGMLVLVPVLQYVINTAGWRTAYIVLGAIALIVIPAMTLVFHRHRPEDMGLLPDGNPVAALKQAASGRQPAQVFVVDKAWAAYHWTVGSALATRRFWVLFFGIMLGTLSHQSVMVHQVAYLADRQFDPMLGASIVGLVGIVGSVGKIFWGWLSDRIGRESAYSLGMTCVVLGVLVLSAVSDPSQMWGPYFYALVFGVGYGVFAPLMSSTSADIFQGRRFGSIYGMIALGGGTGSAIGPWASGLAFDLTGSYTWAFVMAIVAAILSIVCFWVAAPRKVRLVPGMAAKRTTTTTQGS